ncbi:Trk system potassium uptake protein trkA [Slackia heliotrinireducens]|uniref:K+ transport system, NAD-binding component n=1 Tax=Slackia heliotrinireducens (strain ATCC 29202 / DSM 20476 / NCTC 11029 / RHS 1) TaxID=471855 RepID=C7N2V0_SLAHD|nr:NAD-binding protein [Slackia heliotrinireducens]ACV21471.1 K+ transport system, NAD-binding component [Slackia heliotrinireducens DSM 20476]VEG98910.1 Trk system potassium uptake protein trkA [Slackia heliotrinireducens]
MSLLGGKRAVVVGCGSFGAAAAGALCRLGYKTSVIDMDVSAFNRLSPDFEGDTITGDGTSFAVLKDSGVQTASLLVCATSHDTANMLAAEVGSDVCGCANVFARINNQAIASVLENHNVEVICPHQVLVKELCVQAGFNVPVVHPRREGYIS